MIKKVIEKKTIEEVKEVKIEVTLTAEQFDVLMEALHRTSFDMDAVRDVEDDYAYYYRDNQREGEEYIAEAKHKQSVLKEVQKKLQED